MKQLLVVGARPGSLGYHVAITAAGRGWAVTTAGIKGETVKLDVQEPGSVHRLVDSHDWHSVVCTVGVNHEDKVGSIGFHRSLREQALTNYIGPLALLNYWYNTWAGRFKEAVDTSSFDEYEEYPFCFAVISSNSAHVARSGSTGYCASKAALSMGVRCMARAIADERFGDMFNVYGYEPGWLKGTPMSDRVEERVKGASLTTPTLHRIPGDREVEPELLAERIVSDLVFGPHYLNGCMLRLDGGEQ